VFVEDASKPVMSTDVQVDDARRFGNRVEVGAEWSLQRFKDSGTWSELAFRRIS
jgi:squalene cyclase